MKIAGGVALIGATATVLYTAQSAFPSGTFLATQTSELQQVYINYIAQHGKNYLSTEEFELRFEQFAKTHHEIEMHNAKNLSWTLGHNHLSDWTVQEKNSMNGYKPIVRETSGVVIDTTSTPASCDWRHLNAVSHVKNQGQCGSCWAFSTTGSVESHTEITHGNYVSLSEQQLVDCSQWNNGCQGGNFDWAFGYAKTNGLEGEADYPYTAANGSCAFKSRDVKNRSVIGF